MYFTIITDSYGGPRVHNDAGAVSEAATYPVLLKQELEKRGHHVSISHASFRKITDLPELVKKSGRSDVYVLQAGIVDLYPRPLSQEYTVSQAFLPKLVRRIIRLNRRFFIKYLSNRSWSSPEQVYNAVKECMVNNNVRFFWVNVPPVNRFQEHQTPGANASIDHVNALIAKAVAECNHADIVDVAKHFKQLTNMESYLHPVDSHLNNKGNLEYYQCIMDQFTQSNIL